MEDDKERKMNEQIETRDHAIVSKEFTSLSSTAGTVPPTLALPYGSGPPIQCIVP